MRYPRPYMCSHTTDLWRLQTLYIEMKCKDLNNLVQVCTLTGLWRLRPHNPTPQEDIWEKSPTQVGPRSRQRSFTGNRLRLYQISTDAGKTASAREATPPFCPVGKFIPHINNALPPTRSRRTYDKEIYKACRARRARQHADRKFAAWIG